MAQGDKIYVGTTGTTTATANSVVQRDASSDITARLFKSEYDTTNTDINFVMTQVDTASDNAIRPSTPVQLAAAIQPHLSAATGSNSDQIFFENDQTVTSSYSITAGMNAMSTGPISINDGVTVTIPTGSTWLII